MFDDGPASCNRVIGSGTGNDCKYLHLPASPRNQAAVTTGGLGTLDASLLGGTTFAMLRDGVVHTAEVALPACVDGDGDGVGRVSDGGYDCDDTDGEVGAVWSGGGQLSCVCDDRWSLRPVDERQNTPESGCVCFFWIRLSLVCSSCRAPHGVASYVRMSKRNRFDRR